MGDYAPAGLFWFSLMLINAGLAEQKGRSRLAWFALSMFLGPIATLCIVVWAPVPTATDSSGPGPAPEATPPPAS